MSRSSTGQSISGVLIVNKPKGPTSNYVVQALKRWTNAKKVGHMGTLDPMATGVLPIVFGEATKFSQYGLDSNKVYRARIQFGSATNTLDAEGEVVAKRPVSLLRKNDVMSVLQTLTGSLMQIPPMVSALKYQGQPLYKLAREGKEVERPPRPIHIYSNELLLLNVADSWLDIRVHCSKGTYIRSLAETIGEKLGNLAHLSKLSRESSGGFDLSGALPLQYLKEKETNQFDFSDITMLSIDSLLIHLPKIEMLENDCRMLIQGKKVSGKVGDFCGTMRAYFKDGPFIGVVTVKQDGVMSAKRMLSPAATGMRGSSGFGQ